MNIFEITPMLLAKSSKQGTRNVAKEKVPNNFLKSISLAEKTSKEHLNQVPPLDFLQL